MASTKPPGVLIVGCSPWTAAMAEVFMKAEVPVLIADRNWTHLRHGRAVGARTFYGEILSEHAEHNLSLGNYGFLIAATDNDDYNALICTDFGPEFGRNNVFQLGRNGEDDGARRVTLGGRQLARGLGYDEMARRFADGWEFVSTPISEEYGVETYLAERDGVEVIGVIRGGSGKVVFATDGAMPSVSAGDTVMGFLKRGEAA